MIDEVRFVGADWSIRPAKRFAFVGAKTAAPLPRPPSLLELAEAVRSPRHPTLIGLDVGLGIPSDLGRTSRADGFRDWVCRGPAMADRVAERPADWSPWRPFFRVPAGAGGLSAFRRRGSLWRGVDGRTGAKSVFILSGIPGAVGGQCASVWEELRSRPKALRWWPFDGSLSALLEPGQVVLAEVYPSLLRRRWGSGRPASKQDPAHRADVLVRTEAPRTVVELAAASDDALDAWLIWRHLAGNWARGELEPENVDPRFEGGMLDRWLDPPVDRSGPGTTGSPAVDGPS
jgi:hypothetical protein